MPYLTEFDLTVIVECLCTVSSEPGAKAGFVDVTALYTELNRTKAQLLD